MKIRIEIAPQYEHLRPFIADIAENGVPEERARLVYAARNRVYALTAPGGEELSVKAFRSPSFPNCYVYTHLRQSKARRSMENALRLVEMGFDTPGPVAYVECTEHGRLTRSYYISRQIAADGDLRRWLDNPLAAKAMPGAAHLLARLHREGVFHKDFTPGNIMFSALPDGTFRYDLIDLNRMQFDVHRPKRLLRNLAAIYIESEEETARFGRLYGIATGMDPDKAEAEARAQMHRFIAHKRLLKRLKHPFNPKYP